MHIEPGIVHGAKMVLAVGTAAASAAVSLKLMADEVRGGGLPSFAARAALATVGVLMFFEVLPHFPVGVSEVHLILGTTLLLLLGTGAAAFGLAAGLLIQGTFFAPTDLPMYFVNVTTLLMPLFAIHAIARRALPKEVAFVDLGYRDVLKLSVAYQGGVVAWVAFWAFYGQGVSATTLASVGSFGAAYMTVVLLEPLVDLAVLAGAKSLKGLKNSGLVTQRLYNAA